MSALGYVNADQQTAICSVIMQPRHLAEVDSDEHMVVCALVPADEYDAMVAELERLRDKVQTVREAINAHRASNNADARWGANVLADIVRDAIDGKP